MQEPGACHVWIMNKPIAWKQINSKKNKVQELSECYMWTMKKPTTRKWDDKKKI